MWSSTSSTRLFSAADYWATTRLERTQVDAQRGQGGRRFASSRCPARSDPWRRPMGRLANVHRLDRHGSGQCVRIANSCLSRRRQHEYVRAVVGRSVPPRVVLFAEPLSADLPAAVRRPTHAAPWRASCWLTNRLASPEPCETRLEPGTQRWPGSRERLRTGKWADETLVPERLLWRNDTVLFSGPRRLTGPTRDSTTMAKNTSATKKTPSGWSGMSDEHKVALAEGREQGRAVRPAQARPQAHKRIGYAPPPGPRRSLVARRASRPPTPDPAADGPPSRTGCHGWRRWLTWSSWRQLS